MQDRVPLYPGRVKMTPVAGQANTYDMVRADDPTQAGTPLNKASLLKDATAALYGLTSSAVPDDIFAAIGKYKQYWWRRRTKTEIVKYKLEQGKEHSSENGVIFLYAPIGQTNTVKVYSSLTVDENTGEITGQYSENTWLSGGSSASNPGANKYFVNIDIPDDNPVPRYYKVEAGKLYLSGSSIKLSFSSDNSYIYLSSGEIYECSVSPYVDGYTYGDWQYIQSSNRSAYPDSGTQDGYEYEYLGVPFDNAVTAPKIEIGSYTGTGTYGQANPVTLTFKNIPQIVFLNLQKTEQYNSIPEHYILYYGTTSTAAYGASSTMPVSWDGKTVSWYGTSAACQMNKQEEVYRYMAICL